jgi:hypothetical protein
MTDRHPQAAHGGRLAGLDHPLRNRVTLSGELIATIHRGTMYGNRGVLHNDDLALVRYYQVRRPHRFESMLIKAIAQTLGISRNMVWSAWRATACRSTSARR